MTNQTQYLTTNNEPIDYNITEEFDLTGCEIPIPHIPVILKNHKGEEAYRDFRPIGKTIFENIHINLGKANTSEEEDFKSGSGLLITCQNPNSLPIKVFLKDGELHPRNSQDKETGTQLIRGLVQKLIEQSEKRKGIFAGVDYGPRLDFLQTQLTRKEGEYNIILQNSQ